MRIYLATIMCIFFIAMPAHAEDDWRAMCNSVASIAETIMKARQDGVSMAKMMEIPEPEGSNGLGEGLIIAAYESPRYSTEEMQTRSIEEFRDKAYLQCVKAIKPKPKARRSKITRE